MTEKKIYIENIEKKINELLANQELLLKHLQLQSGRKPNGKIVLL